MRGTSHTIFIIPNTTLQSAHLQLPFKIEETGLASKFTSPWSNCYLGSITLTSDSVSSCLILCLQCLALALTLPWLVDVDGRKAWVTTDPGLEERKAKPNMKSELKTHAWVCLCLCLYLAVKIGELLNAECAPWRSVWQVGFCMGQERGTRGCSSTGRRVLSQSQGASPLGRRTMLSCNLYLSSSDGTLWFAISVCSCDQKWTWLGLSISVCTLSAFWFVSKAAAFWK